MCSVALAEDERIVCSHRSTEPRAHASLTAVFVKEMLEESGWTVRELDAVAVSAGPGSYTGLRVGSSTAKGLCFGGQLPLIAVNTLDILARQAIEAGLPEGCKAILPMVDARRMEVYTAVYSPEGIRQTDISPVILDENSFAGLFASGPVAVIGDAAEKFAPLRATADGSVFMQCCPEASAMLVPAMRKYEKKEFEDTAYFEPFYLKQFIATTPKKLF
jgi:tRNA threonylcarbamoyladenosine biosynthesis protein TsaB